MTRVCSRHRAATYHRAAAVVHVAEHPASSWTDRRLQERCITFGVPKPFAGYNMYYQIIQTPGYVVILHEVIHDARIIPLDGPSHLSDDVRQWHGDARGHWDGDTLVVETTNFSAKSERALRGDLEGHAVGVLFVREVDLIEPIDLEGHADPVARKVLQDGQRDQRVRARRPWLGGGERPARLPVRHIG